MPKAVPLLFVDLDGTVRHGYDELGRFVHTAEDVVLFPEAKDLLWKWKKGGGRIVAVSNQGGIALGHVSAEDVHSNMSRTQYLTGSVFDLMMWCSHHPDAEEMEMARCWCRKPLPGLPIEAANTLNRRYTQEYYPPSMALFVGDRPEDEACAKMMGIDFQLAAPWRLSAALI